MGKTFEQIDQARAKYALLTQEELETLTAPKVRAIAIECDIRYIERDGQTIRVSNGRKSEFIREILKVCDEKRVLMQVSQEMPELQVERIQAVASEENEKSLNEDGTIAKETWDDLRRYILERWDSETQTWLATNGNLNRMGNRLVTRLLAAKQAPTTTLNRKAVILKNMRLMLQEDKSNPHYRQMVDVFEDFGQIVQDTLRDLTETKNINFRANLHRRGNEVCSVRTGKLYDWAVDTLVNLQETDPASRWRDVAIALMLVTGRRQSEIMSSAIFTETGSEDSVMFSGQLKTKGRLDAPQAYEIPVLAPSASVIKALNWLIANGKRHEDPKTAHNRYSKELSGRIQGINAYYEIEFKPETKDGKEPKGARLTCHLCRQIYAQKMAKTPQASQGRKPRRYLAEILGHGDDDATVESYDADVNVLD